MALDALLADDYKIDLEVFEGPLDLLLFLVRREEVDIYDIPIEKIAAQYMQYLDMMRMLDLNIAGEFLVMATTLMMIKSRMLLPVEARSTDEDTDEEWIDPRLDLVRQLIEYKKFKDAAERLLELEITQAEAFAYGGEYPELENAESSPPQSLGDIGLFDLLSAFRDVLARAPEEPFGYIEPVRWSVPDKMEAITRLLQNGERIAFSRLFSPESHRGEIIVTFLALLELLRLRQILLFQNAAFHEILILPVIEGELEPIAPPVANGGERVEF